MVRFYDPLKDGPQQGDAKFEVDPRIKNTVREFEARIKNGLSITPSPFAERVARLQSERATAGSAS